MAKPQERSCAICQSYFEPDPRTRQGQGYRQKVCSKLRCQRERKKRYWRRCMASRPKSLKRHQEQTRLWAQSWPSYWSLYRRRQDTVLYREREIQRMRHKRKSLRRVAKQVQITALYIERLRAVQTWGIDGENVAKQVQIARGLHEIAECLIWKERVAKQVQIASGPSGNG